MKNIIIYYYFKKNIAAAHLLTKYFWKCVNLLGIQRLDATHRFLFSIFNGQPGIMYTLSL